MAILAEYRGQGIGTSLLARLIESAEGVYEYLSLSVAAENPARRLYRRLGFAEIGTCNDSITMRRKL
jgi:ribosomal protein S18 acetylase RimI-like enzyme